MSDAQPYRLIISGGGTGGHIFPALAIANEFRQRHPDAHILFVGARGKMEMTRVPEAGYKIVGLWISGIQRKWSLANLLFPLKLIVSYGQAARIVNKYKPHAVIGTGGYASGPVMLAATRRNIPALIQEQNSYAGLTNKQLAAKIRLTGNPVRKDIINLAERQEHALGQFAFDTNLKTLLVLGGSLGARTINESMLAGIDKFIDAKVQVIWQTGRAYYESVKAQVKDKDLRKIRIHDFLHQMDLAYAASDVVISRAGALAISELCLAERPSILVPSPNVAEDHQTKNAISLASKEAAVVVKDEEARGRLVDEALKLLFDDHRCRLLSGNIAKLARPDATDQIVNEIEEMIRVAS
jgi:UDP-N-acetylglucosamine--N-acetylmuramyl-(pentapeptide) pyrophosphoryl-undecaprenol N-acetylglucosamine transferase